MLEYKNISYQIADKQILDNINFKLEAGKITAILGSNGSGKSSLIKLLLKNKREYSGEITINGKPFIKTSDVSILMQSTIIPDHFTVYDFMKYSLIGSRSILSKVTDKDNSQIDSCLEKCDRGSKVYDRGSKGYDRGSKGYDRGSKGYGEGVKDMIEGVKDLIEGLKYLIEGVMDMIEVVKDMERE